MTINQENLGPAERILQTLLTYADHCYHGRVGLVTRDNTNAVGVKWSPVTYREENGVKNVYSLTKVGKKIVRTKIGVLGTDNKVTNGSAQVGEYRPSGVFAEVCQWMYSQIAEVWKLDNEFAARWASYAFEQDHRDLKVVLAAFMLVQSRKGDPVKEDGKVLFHDEDFRDVGEAMMLLQRKDQKDLNPKLLMRIHDVLTLPGVAKINRELGFGNSARNPFLGRWTKAAEKWLTYREENPKLLEGLVKAGFRTTVMDLARAVGYKPTSPKFFETLRWKQKQAKDGRRGLAIGVETKTAESWANLNETQICERIAKDRPNYKRLVGMLPPSSLTKAVFAAMMDTSGCFSEKDLVILSPTLESVGILEVPKYKAKWEAATKKMTDSRAANILKNVKSKDIAAVLQTSVDNSAKAAVEEAMRGLKVWVCLDVSGSMQNSLKIAKDILPKLLTAFPDKGQVTTCVFNTVARIVNIQHPSSAGVNAALSQFNAGGGTHHSSILDVMSQFCQKEGEDLVILWIGDSGQHGQGSENFRAKKITPAAFGFLKVGHEGRYIEDTAAQLKIPCFDIKPDTFSDPYAVSRILVNLMKSTPVSAVNTTRPVAQRVTLASQIISHPLLVKPTWA